MYPNSDVSQSSSKTTGRSKSSECIRTGEMRRVVRFYIPWFEVFIKQQRCQCRGKLTGKLLTSEARDDAAEGSKYPRYSREPRQRAPIAFVEGISRLSSRAWKLAASGNGSGENRGMFFKAGLRYLSEIGEH